MNETEEAAEDEEEANSEEGDESHEVGLSYLAKEGTINNWTIITILRRIK